MKTIYNNYVLAEARNQIPAGLAAKLAVSTVLLAGSKAFQESYFGSRVWNKAADSVNSARTEAENFAGNMQESLLSDLSRKTMRPLREAHSTSDFPLILARVRDEVIRQQRVPQESDLLSLCTRRTANDFRAMNGLKVSMLTDIPVRPEGSDVKYDTLEVTKDGYRIANYERAIGYTWEMYLADDISLFSQALAVLGRRARQARISAVLQAIKDGVAATTYGTDGGPTIDRLKAMAMSFAEQKNGNDEDDPRLISGLYVPAKWQFDIKETLETKTYWYDDNGVQKEKVNPVYNLAPYQVEPIMSRVLGSDWLGIDGSAPSIEFAALAGFEAGPKTYTKTPDVEEHLEEGSFDNHTMAVKVGDAVGAKVTDPDLIRRAKGAA